MSRPWYANSVIRSPHHRDHTFDMTDVMWAATSWAAAVDLRVEQVDRRGRLRFVRVHDDEAVAAVGGKHVK
ncbi:hypothetical protein ACFQX7_28325 [Luedemannella flava]